MPAGRFIAGLGVGALSALIPLYNSEAAPKHLRGPMVVMYQLMICAGIAWSYGLSWATSGIPNRACWMVPVGFQLFLGLFIAVGILLLPESPRLLLSRGNVTGASKSISTLNAVPIDHPLVHEEIAELEALLAVEEQAGKGRWIDLLSTKHQLWKRTLNACMIQFVQQLNGQNCESCFDTDGKDELCLIRHSAYSLLLLRKSNLKHRRLEYSLRYGNRVPPSLRNPTLA